jgi:hypothetical protein
VTKEEYEAWTQQAQEEFARAGNVDVAQSQQQTLREQQK